MKTCTHCGKINPTDTSYCYSCRNPLKQSATIVFPLKRSFWSKLPSWVWILIGLGAIALFIGIIIGGFIGLATIEGFASIIFLIIGIVCFRVFSGTRPSKIPLVRAIMIGFFALMGATIDQTGNYVYNKPVEMCMCPTGSSLNRTTDVSNPLPGRTDMTQNFTCIVNGKEVKLLDMFPIMGIRFLEYILLAYLLLGLRWFLWKRKQQ